MANKSSLPPQLPSGFLNGGGDEGRGRQVGWAIGISALAIILLLSAAIPFIFATKKWADGITELAENGMDAEEDRQPKPTSQPERNLNVGENEFTTIHTPPNTEPENLTNPGTDPTQNTDAANRAPHGEVQNPPEDSDQKPTSSDEISDSGTDGEEAPESPDIKRLPDNADTTQTKAVPGSIPGDGGADALQNISPSGVENSISGDKVIAQNETVNLPSKTLVETVQTKTSITASLHPNLLFNGKEIRFDFSGDMPVSSVSGFYHSRTDEIDSLSSEEKLPKSDKAEFMNASVKVILNLETSSVSTRIAGNFYLLKGDESSEAKSLLKLSEDLRAAHQNILSLRKTFNESSRAPTVSKFDKLPNIDKPILFFDSIDSEVSARLMAVSLFLKKETLKEDEKSVANANAAMLGEIVTNINTARNSIAKINGTLLPLGYLVFNTAQSGSKTLLLTGQNKSSQIHPLTFKLQIPE